MKIVGGKASQFLAGRVAQTLGCGLAIVEFKHFPDGELYTRLLEDIDEVTIVQSTVTDSDLICLLQLIDACEDADKVNVVVPYMGYARQDKVFIKGEAVSARAVARAIKADNIFTINIHSKNILSFFDGNAVDLDAMPLLGKYIGSIGLNNPVIIAPDEGAAHLAQRAASELGIDYDHLEKTRLSGDKVILKAKKLDVMARDVVIVDDMISTGGTMAETISLLREQGARNVYAACIHPVLSSNAVLKLYDAGTKDIIATDTIEKVVSKVTVAPIIAEAIKENL